MRRYGHAASPVLLTVLLLAGCLTDDGEGQSGPTTGGGGEWATTVEPPDTPACRSGDVTCADETLTDMERRLDRLAASCDHNAVFALTYLHITAGYRETSGDPGAFEDVVFMNHLDALFAQFYFTAFDAEATGVLDAVPPAWRIAFDQAQAGQVSAVGDALLGISAHINRDLPFVLAQLGVVAPSGRSRRNDHERVNDIFAHVLLPMLEDTAQRFDPTLAEPKLGGRTLDFESALTLIREWRDAAFRNAERLTSAGSPEARRAVAAEIEDNAAVIARSLQLATTYPSGESSASRDAYCKSQRG